MRPLPPESFQKQEWQKGHETLQGQRSNVTGSVVHLLRCLSICLPPATAGSAPFHPCLFSRPWPSIRIHVLGLQGGGTFGQSFVLLFLFKQI